MEDEQPKKKYDEAAKLNTNDPTKKNYDTPPKSLNGSMEETDLDNLPPPPEVKYLIFSLFQNLPWKSTLRIAIHSFNSFRVSNILLKL